jgi:hypothetical protein
MHEDFYSSVLQAAESAKVIDPTMRVLVVAEVAMTGTSSWRARIERSPSRTSIHASIASGDYAPYTWSYQNAESLSFDADSFDVVVVTCGAPPLPFPSSRAGRDVPRCSACGGAGRSQR